MYLAKPAACTDEEWQLARKHAGWAVREDVLPNAQVTSKRGQLPFVQIAVQETTSETPQATPQDTPAGLQLFGQMLHTKVRIKHAIPQSARVDARMDARAHIYAASLEEVTEKYSGPPVYRFPDKVYDQSAMPHSDWVNSSGGCSPKIVWQINSALRLVEDHPRFNQRKRIGIVYTNGDSQERRHVGIPDTSITGVMCAPRGCDTGHD